MSDYFRYNPVDLDNFITGHFGEDQFKDDKPEGMPFDQYRGAVLAAIRLDGYATCAAINLVRRCEVMIREGWVNKRDPDCMAMECIEFDELDDTLTDPPEENGDEEGDDESDPDRTPLADDSGGGPVG